jgi:uncharacterized protein
MGGNVSIFSVRSAVSRPAPGKARLDIARIASKADAIELELAATALFLAIQNGARDPWQETARRKPEKAEDGRLEKAKALYHKLRQVRTPKPLPDIGEAAKSA